MNALLPRWSSVALALPLAVSLAPVFAGCGAIAVATAPEKVAHRDETPAARQADAVFWDTLHGGRYDEISPALERLQQAYLADPNDPRTAAHIGFLHIWRLSERARRPEVPATITDDLSLARRYFDEATRLEPHDPRFAGFLASTMMGEGDVHHDEKLTRRGFFAMKDAVDAWPEFNLFTRGYTMSRLPHDGERYAQAVEDQWETLDRCIEGRIDRQNPDFAPFMKLETRQGKKRVCWNSWIAPHNFEGFFLNMGDMVVKAGDAESGKRLYAQAKLAKEYPTWPYRDVLDRRIAEAHDNVARFREKNGKDPERRMMIETPFSCMGCHQEK